MRFHGGGGHESPFDHNDSSAAKAAFVNEAITNTLTIISRNGGGMHDRQLLGQIEVVLAHMENDTVVTGVRGGANVRLLLLNLAHVVDAMAAVPMVPAAGRCKMWLDFINGGREVDKVVQVFEQTTTKEYRMNLAGTALSVSVALALAVLLGKAFSGSS